MSYAIIRNEKLTRAQAQGISIHNDRRTKNHSNTDINTELSHLNYYFKKNKLNYIKEFDAIKKQNDLKGQIRSNSIIMCEMIFTSDSDFFKKIGIKETKRYFEESYKFICNYKNLGEKNIISAVVHFDEITPHMHLIYIPVVHTIDKQGNAIDKICARDFWKGKNSYRTLQNSFYKYITQKGFDLQRGLPSEETNRTNIKIKDYKVMTNFEETKKVLDNINLELPEIPDIKDMKKIMINRDEKILTKIIKPKDILIQKLYNDNVSLHKELSKQAKIVDIAENFQREKNNLLAENNTLKKQCQKLECNLEEVKDNLKYDYENKIYNIEYSYHKVINNLEKENIILKKVINKFKDTVHKFISWICNKFDFSNEDTLIRDFEKENHCSLDTDKIIIDVTYKNRKNEHELGL